MSNADGTSPVSGVSEASGLTWWQAALEDAPALLELPHGRASSTQEVQQGLPDQHTDGQRLACAVAGLLARHSLAGVAVFALGAHGAWTPIVVDLADNPSYLDALHRVSVAQKEGGAHPVDLSLLTKAVGPRVAQVAVTLDGTAWGLDDPPSLSIGMVADCLEVRCPAGGADVVLRHLSALLMDWREDQRLADVELLGDAERSRLLEASTGEALSLPDATVWDEISRHVTATPGAVALIDDARRLTYRELDERVTTVASLLVRSRIGRGDLVGLCMGRSVDMVVGLLAIMRSGAAYVPIDPSYPADRIAMMVEDARLSTVVTERALATELPDKITNRIFVDAVTNRESERASDAEQSTLAPSPDDLAYVIFTSGSTGRPKGVMIDHRALLNLVLSIRREPGMSSDDRLLAVTTLSFDIAALELLVPLAAGGCVVVADRTTALDPVELADRLDTHEITVMQATPATWRMLVDSGWDGRPGLRVLCGGEALPVGLAAELQNRCAELWNMYGPTETTIWSLQTLLHDGDPVTIGSPLSNTTVHVVGRHQELLPDGVAGELLIGGAGLARGYLGQPELTAERFLPDWACYGVVSSVYRTGDLVRRRADGRIEFLGRLDHQVKVQGFRIELGEVENALDAHPAVARSVVIVVPGSAAASNRLVGYVVLAPGASSDGRGAAHARRPVPAPLHGALGRRRAGGIPADAEREDRPEATAGTFAGDPGPPGDGAEKCP